MKVLLKNVRLSFPFLYSKQNNTLVKILKNTPLLFLIPKSDTKTVATIEQACKQALVEKIR